MTGRDEKKLSVIIVSYNCYDYLLACLNSIEKYNDIGNGLEVIVVDNGTDGTCDRLQGYPSKYLKAIKTENKGFGAGNNAGVKAAEGEFLLFLNPDTELIEPVFSDMLSRLENDITIGTSGCRLITKNGEYTHSYALRMHLGFLRTQINRILIKTGCFIPRKMYTSGADLFIRRSDFLAVEGFDESIFLYCEEIDLCTRLEKTGKNPAFFPQYRIIHNEGKTSFAGMAEKYRIELCSWVYYFKKNRIDPKPWLRREKRYSAFKGLVFKMLNRTEISDEYKKYVQIAETEIRKLKR